MHSFGDTYMNKIAARYLLQIVAALKKIGKPNHGMQLVTNRRNHVY